MTDEPIYEYEQIQRLRELWSKAIMTWGHIFVPLGAAIIGFLVSQLPKFECSGRGCSFLLIGWCLFTGVMVYWRWVVRDIDNAIVSLYPRMLELEEKLGMELQASYYYQNLNEKAKKRLATYIGKDYDYLKDWDYRAFKDYIKKHEKNNSSPHSFLLKIWDEFVLKDDYFSEKLWINKLWISHITRPVNYSVTSRGHGPQNFVILVIIIAFFILIICGHCGSWW